MDAASTPRAPPCDLDAFVVWLEENGAEIHDNLELVKRAEDDRYVRVKKKIPKGETLFFIPKNLTIRAPSKPYPLPPTNLPQLDETLQIAVALLNERALGGNSKFAPYVTCLPKRCPNLVCQSDATLEYVHGNSFKNIIRDERSAIMKAFDAVETIVSPPPYKMEWLWAVGVVQSRSWDQGLIPFTDFLNSEPGTPHAVEFSKKGAVLKSKGQIDKGAELFLDYGGEAGEQLRLYGFTPTDSASAYVSAKTRINYPKKEAKAALKKLADGGIRVAETDTAGTFEVTLVFKSSKSLDAGTLAFFRSRTAPSEDDYSKPLDGKNELRAMEMFQSALSRFIANEGFNSSATIEHDEAVLKADQERNSKDDDDDDGDDEDDEDDEDDDDEDDEDEPPKKKGKAAPKAAPKKKAKKGDDDDDDDDDDDKKPRKKGKWGSSKKKAARDDDDDDVDEEDVPLTPLTREIVKYRIIRKRCFVATRRAVAERIKALR